MSDLFLVNKEASYTWTGFLTDLNKRSSYTECYGYKSLYDYFLNFVTAIIRNLPLVLIDSDMSDTEIENLGIRDFNKTKHIDKLPEMLIGKDQLINLVKISQAEITLFTSGTTGQPKQVTHTPQTFLRSVRYSSQLQNAVWGYAYNPTHMAGLQVFFQALACGASIVNLFNESSLSVFGLIDKYSITHISATPTFYRLLLPVTHQYDSVIRVTLGGEKSSGQLHQSIIELFPKAKVNNIYASTEAGSLFCSKGNQFSIPHEIRDLVKIVDNELMLHKSLVGHFASLKTECDFYATGDIVRYVDEQEGIFEFESRKNELINIGGYKVNPSEVEDVIHQISGVANVVVYGRDNSVLGKILCADIEPLKGYTEIDVDQIKQIVASKLQPFKVPRIVKLKDRLETTRTGKITRK